MVHCSKISAQVEGKTFVFELWRNPKSDEEVYVFEKNAVKEFQGKLTVGGSRWLGKLLTQLSASSYSDGTEFNFSDRRFKIRAEVKSNKRGKFLKTLISPRENGSRAACLCFPAGFYQEGWSLIGTKIGVLLKPVMSLPPTRILPHSLDGKVRNNVSLASTCDTANPFNPQVSFRSGGAVMGASWWQPVILCQFDGTNPDWFWVRQKIRSTCGEVILKLTQEGEAICVFEEDEAREKLLNLPPLDSWEGRYTFRKWGPMDGALKPENLRGDVNVSLVGIPFHLRVRSVVEALARKCGGEVLIDDESVSLWKASCSFTVKDVDWRSIPRTIAIEERGYKAVIMVEATRKDSTVLEKMTGILPESNHFRENDGGLVQHELDPPITSHVEATLSSCTNSIPPGFEFQKLKVSAEEQLDSTACHTVRNTNPFMQEGEPMVLLESQNMFEPLLSLGDNNRNDQAYEEKESDECVLLSSGGGGGQEHITDNDACLADSEPIRPTIQPSNYLTYARKHRKLHKPNGLKRSFFGHQKWVWLTGTHKHNQRANTKAQSSRVVEASYDDSFTNHAQVEEPQRLSLATPSHSHASTSFSSLSCVPPTPLRPVSGEPSSDSQVKAPSREDVAFSLLSCSSEEDFNRWIRWMVIPFSKEVGMTTSMGVDGQVRLFTDLGKEMDGSIRMQHENLPISNLPQAHSRDSLVSNGA